MRRVVAAALAVAVVGGGAALASGLLRGADPGWQEIAWPFPRDAWAPGRAFRCQTAACGGPAEVYLRAKLGFCSNCATGVTEDTEVDGVSDVDMIAQDFVPASDGEPVVIGGLKGRLRRYTVRMADGRQQAAAGFALSRQCDLFVVASQGQAAGSPASRRGVIDLLQQQAIARWVTAALDG